MRLLTLMMLCFMSGAVVPATISAAESKPVYKWVSANEYYMILPTAQALDISGGGSDIVKPWKKATGDFRRDRIVHV